MYYEINVSYRGQHYFATAPRSLTDVVTAKVVFLDLLSKYPEEDGCLVTVTYHPEIGEDVTGALMEEL